MDPSNAPLISVCIPAYNCAALLRESIESVLNQSFSDFELLIGDDGSMEDYSGLIDSYRDPRIRLIRNRHNFAETLNLLIAQSKGKYIARMDADDRMVQDRLLWQYEYMEAHPEIDLVGSGIRMFGNAAEIHIPSKTHRPLTITDMFAGNIIAHPTVMFRRSTIERFQLRYESEYVPAEDYRLWMRMLQLGLHLENMPEIVLEYRVSEQQVSRLKSRQQKDITRRIQQETEEWVVRKEKPYFLTADSVIPASGNKLTVILTFLNEGDEVINTVQSIRQYAGDSVDILAINDHSYDGYDYHTRLAPYNVHYFYNSERKGVAASRDVGIKLCATPYFLLLDAHMRFYDNEWPRRITDLLERDDRTLLCCQTKVLHLNECGKVVEKRNVPTAYGAYIPFMKNNYMPAVKWKYKENCPDETTEPVPAVLGAGYAASRRYWQYLYGLEGLKLYGSDESYISLKVWLEGGHCLLLKDIAIGHIYRTESPYTTPSAEIVYNYLFIASVLFPASLRLLAFAVARSINKDIYYEALRLLTENERQIETLRTYYQQIFTVSFDKVLSLNRFVDSKHAEELNRQRELLPQIADFLCEKETTDCDGIVKGALSNALFFFHYYRFTGNPDWKRHADTWLAQATAAIEQNEIPIGFVNGICGIGWGLIYLQQQGFVSLAAAEKHLCKIDQRLAVFENSSSLPLTFAEGAGGMLHYLYARILHLRMQKKHSFFSDELISTMKRHATNIERESGNVFSIYSALLFLHVSAHPEESLEEFRFRPSFHDWMNFPSFLARNARHWKVGMDGCAGVGILAMLTSVR